MNERCLPGIRIDSNFYRFGYIRNIPEDKNILIQKQCFEYIVDVWKHLDSLKIL